MAPAATEEVLVERVDSQTQAVDDLAQPTVFRLHESLPEHRPACGGSIAVYPLEASVPDSSNGAVARPAVR